MDSSNNMNSFKSPIKESGNFNVVTSTPFLRSEIGKELVKKQFIKNFPKDISISILEAKISKMTISLNIKDRSNQSSETKPFIFKKEHYSTAPTYEFRTPKTISPETIEKYNKLFEATPKMKFVKRIRL